MPRQTRRSARTTHKKAKKPKKITFHEFLRSLPRPYPDPYIEWHIGFYDAVTNLKRQLEMLTHKPLLSNDDLVKLGVVRGAELIIDEENPIDLEPRFFNPGSAHEVAQGVRNYEETQKWARRYPEQETPINPWSYPEADMDDIKEFACDCWSLVDWRRRYSVRESRFTWKKNPNWDEPFVHRETNFYHYKRDWVHRYLSHEFVLYKWFMSRPFSRGCDPGPEVSHTMVMVADTIKPDDRLLRSELLMAAMLLRDNLAHRFWPAHHTFPVLMFSFCMAGCRLLQIHLDKGKLHIRVSRALDLTSRDGTVPPDAHIAARWLLAEIIGKTLFSAIPRTDMGASDHDGPQNPGASTALSLFHSPVGSAFALDKSETPAMHKATFI